MDQISATFMYFDVLGLVLRIVAQLDERRVWAMVAAAGRSRLIVGGTYPFRQDHLAAGGS